MGKTLVQVKKGKREFSKILAITASICLLWGCVYDIGMNSIPDDLEFNSRAKFVLHSNDKVDRLSLCGFRVRSNTHASLAPDYIYTICDFQSGTKFVLSFHDTRMKFPTRTRISFGLKSGMT